MANTHTEQSNEKKVRVQREGETEGIYYFDINVCIMNYEAPNDVCVDSHVWLIIVPGDELIVGDDDTVTKVDSVLWTTINRDWKQKYYVYPNLVIVFSSFRARTERRNHQCFISSYIRPNTERQDIIHCIIFFCQCPKNQLFNRISGPNTPSNVIRLLPASLIENKKFRYSNS